MRWPKGTSLVPKPCFFSCPFFAFNRKTLFSDYERAFLYIFECLPLFLLSLFLASPFFTFSFSVSLLFFSCFLPSCHSFLFSFGSLFLFLSLMFIVLCFCFMKRTTANSIFHCSSILSMFLVSCLAFSLKSIFCYLCFLLL